MPFQLDRGPAVIIAKEILRSAAGLDDIKSGVIDSTLVVENPASSGRYILEAGTVLASGPSSGRLEPIYDGDTVAEADVVGILGATIEFWLGVGITAGRATDEAVPVLHHGCNFDTSELVGYTGNETAVEAALPTCLFT